MKVSFLVLATLFLVIPRAFSDSVTLNSGEVIQGDILSETETQLVIMAVNYNRTITSRRTILRSDIAKVDRESTQQKVERRAYEALGDRLRLDSNRELSKAEYESGIEAFNNYLTTYPESKFVGDVQKRLSLWKDELSHVEQGEVKFANKWMTPEEKKPLLLNKQLAELERQRDSLAVGVEGARGRLGGLQTKLGTLADTQEPVYNTRLVGPGHYSQSYLAGYKTVPNPERPKVQAEIVSCQQQIGSGSAALASLDTRIQSVRSQILEIQRAQEIALAKSRQESVQAAAAQPSAAPEQAAVETPPPPVAAPNSWLKENWKWLAGGAAALIIVVGYFVSRFTANRIICQLAEEESRLRDEKLAKRREAELAGRPMGGEDPPGEQ